MVIPVPVADPGFETVDDPVPAPKKSAPVPSVKTDVMLDDDEEDEKPRAKKKPARKEPDEDDEEEEADERPRKKSKGAGKKKAKGLAPAALIGLIAAGVLLLGGGIFVMYWFGIREEKPKETSNNTIPSGPQPGGSGGPPPIPGGSSPAPAPSAPVKPLYESGTSTQRQISNNNLKQVGLAFHNFDSSYGALPAGIYDSSGKVGLSWRVAILPFIEQDGLYKQFKLNEPWDSENNKKLIPLMPRMLAAPGKEPNDGLTYYRSFTGEGTAFPPPKNGQAGKPAMGLKLSGFADGTSNTAVVAEAGDPVTWTKPDELVYTPGGTLPRVGGIFGNGFHVVLGDGSTRFVKPTVSPETLKAMITAQGGEVVDFEK